MTGLQRKAVNSHDNSVYRVLCVSDKRQNTMYCHAKGTPSSLTKRQNVIEAFVPAKLERPQNGAAHACITLLL